MFRSTLLSILLAVLLVFGLACDDGQSSDLQGEDAAAADAAADVSPATPTSSNRYDKFNYAFPRPTTGPDGQPYTGPFFDVPEDWPTTPPAEPKGPWDNYASIDASNVEDFMVDMRNYVFAALLPVDWRFQDQPSQERWYSGPWMPRETVRGMYDGNNQPAGSYGPDQVDCAVNYTLDLYNHVGGYTFGQVWGDPSRSVHDPNITVTSTQFPEGTVVAKLAMTSLPVAQVPSLANAPTWWIYRESVQSPADCSTQTAGPLEWIEVRIMQMDVIVKDSRLAPETGWVFGTLAYNQEPDARGWDESMPADWKPWYQSSAVGAMWGNDPEAPNPGDPLTQTMIGPHVNSVNKALLGYGGRLSGPIDGGQPVPGATPGSSCMSCHSTAQVPVEFALLVPAEPIQSGHTLMDWFQNPGGNVPFTAGAIASDYDFVIAAGASHAAQGKSGKSFSEMDTLVGKHH